MTVLITRKSSGGGGAILQPFNAAAQTANTWITVNNNTLDSVDSTHTNNGFSPVTQPDGVFSSILYTWCNCAFDPDNQVYYVGPGGGHDDWDGNDHYSFDTTSSSGLYLRRRNPSTNTGGHEGINTKSDWGDGNPRAIHSYNSKVWAKGRLWLAAMPATAGSLGGKSSTAVYSWAPGETDWTYHGLGIAVDPSGGNESQWTYVEACAAYDSVDQKIWVMSGVAGAGKSYYSINLAAYPTVTFTEYDDHVDLGRYGWATVLTTNRILVRASMNNATLQYLDLNNPTNGFNGLTFTGTPDLISSGDHYQGFYDSVDGRIYGWHAGDGKNIRYLTVPGNPVSGTWVGGTITGGGSVTPSTADPPSAGTFGKPQFFRDTTGQAWFIMVLETSGATYRYKF